MKELEGEKFAIEVKLNAEQKIESRLIGRVFLKRGQCMYWYNPSTNEMDKVKLNKVQFEKGQTPVQEIGYSNPNDIMKAPTKSYTIYLPNSKYANLIHSQASYDTNKLYCVAINDKNASKKFAKMLFDLTTKHKYNG